jgi:DNA-binding winged helix-turn-helix (wHTH) protein
MDASVAGDREFGSFRLDRSGGRLLRFDPEGAPIPITIGARALAVLCVLVDRSGEVVSKQEIMDAVWPDTTVQDKNLAVQVSTLRQTLEHEGGAGAWIQTVPGRGYRFMAPTAETQRAAYSPQDRRQSIIVIAFENASANPALDEIASNVTREVTDIFARMPSVPSIPDATAATYRGKPPLDLRRIGREHDVHFALLGNTRQQDGRLVVSVTLYETAHGKQVWAQRFEHAEGVETGPWTVASLIHQHVDQATIDEESSMAQRDHPGQLDKRDLMFAAYVSNTLQVSKPVIEAQIALTERALALDPNYVWALQANGRRHADLVIHGFSDDPARDIAIATKAVDRALQLAPNDYATLKEKTYVLRAKGNWLEAEALTRRLLELRPRVSARHSNLGSILMAQGRNVEALDALLASKRLQIATDDIAVVDANIAATLLATGRLREAIDQAQLAIPQFTPANGRIAELPWLVLIAAQSANGRAAEARADLDRFLAVPRTWNTIAAMQDVPFLAAHSVLLDGLRDAGMPLR